MKIQLPFLFLAVTLLVAPAFNSPAGIITTYAGGGTNGNFSNTIGFPATNALLVGIQDVAVDLLGNLYIAHFTGHRVLRVDHTNGLITSFAGTGVLGYGGDGGPATDAQLDGPMCVVVDLSGNVFVADAFDSRVRKIDAATGIITAVAGRSGDFGWTGDGGPATNASLSTPEGVAVDVHGNLYIADTFNFEVRKVDAASGIIHTIAGQFSNFGYTGDGGPATNALLNGPAQVAVDLSGNLFILDTSSTNHIRRIDAQTGIITTVAGGGAGDGASGSATNANLNSAQDLAVDAFGGLYIGGDSGLWKVDLASGNISIVAGLGGTSMGFSGDGGPATNAMVNGLFGIAVSGTGDFFLADAGNDRVRRVTPDTVPPYAVLVDLTTAQTFMTPQPEVQGRLGLATVNGRLSVVLPTDTNVTSGLFLTGTNGLKIFGTSGSGTLTFPALNSFGGNLSLVDNCGPTNINLSSLTNLGGSLTISSNCAASVTVASPTVGGSLTVSTGPSAIVSVGSPTVANGLIVSTGSGGRVKVDSPNVTADLTVTTGPSAIVRVGSANVNGNITFTGGDGSSISLSGTTAGGSASLNGGSNSVVTVTGGNVTGNLTYTTGNGANISLSNTWVGGSATIQDGSSSTILIGGADVSGGVTVNGGDSNNVRIVGGTFHSSLLVTNGDGSVTFITGNGFHGDVVVDIHPASSVVFSNNAADCNVTIRDGTSSTLLVGSSTIGGNLTVTSGDSSIVDVSGAHVSGNTTVTATGPTNVTLSTALGSTSVTLSNGAATMQAVLPAGTFMSNVVFSVSTVPPASLPTFGTMSNVSPSVISAVSAYHFSFAIPTLNQDATLTFVIQLSALEPTNRAAFLDALNAGAATVAVLGDAPGSVLQVFPVCGLGVTPSAGGCVSVTKLDATGTPLPDGSLAEPASVRFSGVAGHFSTWAVVLAKPLRVTPTLLGNGQLRLAWPGVVGGILEASTNLAPNSWSPAGAPTYLPDGTVRLDISPTNPARFYRVKAQ